MTDAPHFFYLITIGVKPGTWICSFCSEFSDHSKHLESDGSYVLRWGWLYDEGSARCSCSYRAEQCAHLNIKEAEVRA